MKKFTPIAMKCTQKDWESIKSNFSESQISSVYDFDNFGYLVNNHFGNKLHLANLSNGNNYGRTEYKTFDANIFLNACGIDYYEVVKSNKPIHYQTENNIDIIDFCKMYNLNFNRGNVIKYVSRAGKKDDEIKDLEKALDFIQREIKYLKEK